jgi:hypothetical protein
MKSLPKRFNTRSAERRSQQFRLIFWVDRSSPNRARARRPSSSLPPLHRPRLKIEDEDEHEHEHDNDSRAKGGCPFSGTKKIGGESNLLLFQQTTDLNNCAFYFLAALFFTGEAAFLATFLAGAFLAGAFLAGAGFLAAGFAAAFFAAGISYPPFHSAVAEDKKLISFQFA